MRNILIHIINTRLILLVMLVCVFNLSYSQTQDSLAIYKKIKEVAEKRKFTAWLYSTIFVDPTAQEYPKEPSSKEKKIVNPYIKHENKIIRNIHVKVYDPFGYSVNDTAQRKINGLQKLGNGLHIASFKRVITSRLLFKESQSLNPLSLSESERLLRQSVFVNDARIAVSDSSGTDSVDVYVMVHDKWTVSMPIVITDVNGYARFKNQNLFGTGNQFEQYVGFTKPDLMAYSGYYNISNIKNSYVSSRLFYSTNHDGTEVGVIFDRPFYSPLAEWAGGAEYNYSWKYFSYTDSVSLKDKRHELNQSYYDVWLGKSIKINAVRKLFNQSTNIIIGERFYLNQFDKRPSFAIDKNRRNLNSSSFIGNIGFAIQQYYKDKFIYRFGANEDVPQGLIVQALYGVTENELGNSKFYIGADVASARHFHAGYFSARLSYGLFFGKSMVNDITTRAKLNYFSDLLRLGKWYIREFVNSTWVLGFNKQPYERLTITGSDLYGFESGTLTGTHKGVVNVETVAYAPYNLIGFRFAPTLMMGCSMIGDEKNKFINSNLYQAYALGLMVRNENLLSSTFEISFGIYPFLPNGQNNVIKYSPVTSFTLKVNAFSVGRPEFIDY